MDSNVEQCQCNNSVFCVMYLQLCTQLYCADQVDVSYTGTAQPPLPMSLMLQTCGCCSFCPGSLSLWPFIIFIA